MTSKRKARIKPVEDAISYILSAGDKPWFAVRCINKIKGMTSSTFSSCKLQQHIFRYYSLLTFFIQKISYRNKWLQSSVLFKSNVFRYTVGVYK